MEEGMERPDVSVESDGCKSRGREVYEDVSIGRFGRKKGGKKGVGVSE